MDIKRTENDKRNTHTYIQTNTKRNKNKLKMDEITIVNAKGVMMMSFEEAKKYLSTIDGILHIVDNHKVLDTLLSTTVLLAGSMCLSYAKKDTSPMIADLSERIKQKQIKLAIVVHKRSYIPETIGTKAWVIYELMRRNVSLSFYDDAIDHLFSAYELSKGSLRTFLVRSGGLSKEEIAKTSVEFSKALTHLPSLIQFLRGGERGAKMMARSRIHRLLYSNASLLARSFEVTLSGPCGNQLKNSSGETINVLHSDDQMSSIVYEIDNRILFHRYYSDRKEYQETTKALVDFIKTH
jgi:hypothetical protein